MSTVRVVAVRYIQIEEDKHMTTTIAIFAGIAFVLLTVCMVMICKADNTATAEDGVSREPWDAQ